MTTTSPAPSVAAQRGCQREQSDVTDFNYLSWAKGLGCSTSDNVLINVIGYLISAYMTSSEPIKIINTGFVKYSKGAH